MLSKGLSFVTRKSIAQLLAHYLQYTAFHMKIGPRAIFQKTAYLHIGTQQCFEGKYWINILRNPKKRDVFFDLRKKALHEKLYWSGPFLSCYNITHFSVLRKELRCGSILIVHFHCASKLAFCSPELHCNNLFRANHMLIEPALNESRLKFITIL